MLHGIRTLERVIETMASVGYLEHDEQHRERSSAKSYPRLYRSAETQGETSKLLLLIKMSSKADLGLLGLICSGSHLEKSAPR